MFKKICAAVVILGAVFSVSAQNIEGVNARIDAMGGFGVPADIGWIIDKPCALYVFPDQIQFNIVLKDIEGSGKTYGPIIITKSLGPRFLIGLTMNDKRAMFGKFYTVSKEFGGFMENFSAMEMGKWLPNWPHLTLCIKPNDRLSLGVGTFFEYSKYDADHTKEFQYTSLDINNNPVVNKIGYDSTTVRKYHGIGVIADARIWFGGVRLNPEFKFFVPKLDGNDQMNLGTVINKNQNVAQNTSVISYTDKAQTTDFSNNFYLRAGGKLSGTIIHTFWIGGFWYKTERFELERTLTKDSIVFTPNNTTAWDTTFAISKKTHAFDNTSYDWWLGCQPSYLENIIFGTEYAGALQVSKASAPQGKTTDSTLLVFKHKFRFGVEGKVPIKLFHIWDLTFLPRAGLIFYTGKEVWRYKIAANDTSLINEKIKWPYSTNWDKDLTDAGKGAKVCAGFGFKGKRGALDASVDLLTWGQTPVFVGPAAAMASFTFYFGRKIDK